MLRMGGVVEAVGVSLLLLVTIPLTSAGQLDRAVDFAIPHLICESMFTYYVT